MEPIRNAAEHHLFVEFFEHLGIDDEAKLGFLSTLLRNAFDSISKLDMHLAPYGAALHCAVSRMVVSKNPREAPCHRWIRVVDRLGFFADGNDHAERIVNVGLAYAYRHLELDALARANAVLLQQTHSAAGNGVSGDDAKLPLGGDDVTSKDGVGEDPPALLDKPIVDEEAPLPAGGLLVSAGGKTPARDGNGDEESELPPGGLIVSTVSGGTPMPSGTTPVNPAAFNAGQPVSNGLQPAAAATTMAAMTTAAAAAAAAAAATAVADAAAASADDDADADGDGDGDADGDAVNGSCTKVVPSHLIFERQPTVHPPAPAVEVVSAVLRTMSASEDGADMLRKLLSDGVVTLARTGAHAQGAMGAAGSEANKYDLQAVYRTCSAWWPQWHSPTHPSSMSPPPGTVSFKVNPQRVANTTRWVVMVDMAGVNPTMEEIKVKSSRFFKKESLPAVEHVVRVSGKSPMKLTVVIAALLLVATKEERFGSILSSLAFAGRANVLKVSPLTGAFRHEFFSAGLTTSTPASSQATAAGDSLQDPGGQAAAAALQSPHAVNLDERYADMDAALRTETVQEATRRRAERMMKNQARGRTLSSQSRSRSGSAGPGAEAAGPGRALAVGADGSGGAVASGPAGRAGVRVVVAAGLGSGLPALASAGAVQGASASGAPLPILPGGQASQLGGTASAGSQLPGSRASAGKPPRGVKRARPSRAKAATAAGRGRGGGRDAALTTSSSAGRGPGHGRARGGTAPGGASPEGTVAGGAAGKGPVLGAGAGPVDGPPGPTLPSSSLLVSTGAVVTGATLVSTLPPSPSGVASAASVVPLDMTEQLPGGAATERSEQRVSDEFSREMPVVGATHSLSLCGPAGLAEPLDVPPAFSAMPSLLSSPGDGERARALPGAPRDERDVSALPPVPPLSFSEEMRARRARVDADLDASHASLLALGFSTLPSPHSGADPVEK